MKDLLRSWNIGTILLVEPVRSYTGNVWLVMTQEQGTFILKKKPDLQATEREANLLPRLSEVGAPVAVPVRTGDGRWYALREGVRFCLYHQLPGQIIAEHYAGDTTARAEMFGSAIAFLHSCLLKCQGASDYPEMWLMEQIRQWAIPRIREHNAILDGGSMEQAWTAVEQEMGPLYDELPKQLIHRDLHPANMLFDAGTLAGFVDFELVVRGPRIFDVCYCGTSILVGAFPDTDKMAGWPALFRSLLKGYQTICPLTSSELLSLYGILVAIEVLFAAWSLETGAEGAARCNASVLSWLSANRETIGV